MPWECGHVGVREVRLLLVRTERPLQPIGASLQPASINGIQISSSSGLTERGFRCLQLQSSSGRSVRAFWCTEKWSQPYLSAWGVTYTSPQGYVHPRTVFSVVVTFEGRHTSHSTTVAATNQHRTFNNSSKSERLAMWMVNILGRRIQRLLNI